MPVTGHAPIRRLLMTVDTVGDVWTYALDLAQALQAYSIDMALAIMGPPLTTQQRAAVQQLQNITIYESTCKLEWMEGSWDDVEAAGAWLLELEALTQPDVVHLNGYAHGALPWQAPTLMLGHACVLSWFAAVNRTLPAVGWERYRRTVAGAPSWLSVRVCVPYGIPQSAWPESMWRCMPGSGVCAPLCVW